MNLSFKQPLYLFAGLVVFFSLFIFGLEVDASSKTLLSNNNSQKLFLKQLQKRYGDDNYLVVAFAPKGRLFAANTLETIKQIHKKIEAQPWVARVDSPVSVPLLLAPRVSLVRLALERFTLFEDHFEPEALRYEFSKNPFYANTIVGDNLTQCAFILRLKPLNLEQREKAIRDLRALIGHYKDRGSFYLSGLDLIMNDVRSAIFDELSFYAFALVLLLLGVIYLLFRRLSWVLSALVLGYGAIAGMLCCFVLLGLSISILSANVIALEMIIFLSMFIHLAAGANSLFAEYETKEALERSKALHLKPIVFAALTTAIGFASLGFSTLKPVSDLGLMMVVGIAVALGVVYYFFVPISALMLGVNKRPQGGLKKAMLFLPVGSKGFMVVALSALLFGLWGVKNLSVENSFVNYFKPQTEIAKGLHFVDNHLGGTANIELLVTLPKPKQGDDEEDEFADEFAAEANEPKYWFTNERIAMIKAIHTNLERVYGVGKVVSLWSVLELLSRLNDGESFDAMELGLLYEYLPQKIKKAAIAPYLNFEHNELRFSLRIKDSTKGLKRETMLKEIRAIATAKLREFPGATVKLGGVMVIYNQILQGLFASQKSSLLFTFGLLFVMLWLVMGSFKMALSGMVVNMLSILMMFGLMSLMGIWLDVMTVLAAAVAVGIGIDDTIHYLFAIKKYKEAGYSFEQTIARASASTGRAMLYTTLVISIGFGVLLFSTLVSTAHFGMLVIAAMLLAWAANIFLLPRMLWLMGYFANRSIS